MNIILKFKRLFFFRQHPEAALRYIPIVNLLKKEKLINSKILEVGSGSLGIAPYLNKEVTGVDISFSEPAYPLLKQVTGSAEHLPFKKRRYDVVILSDVLEHLPKNIRQKVLSEVARVAKKALIISGPFGKKSDQQDQILSEYSLIKIGQVHSFLSEHLKYGLPEVNDTEEMLKKIKKVKEIKLIGEYTNLKVRERLMKIYITKHKWQYYFYLKGLMFLIPLLRFLNKPPTYRTLLFVRLRNE